MYKPSNCSAYDSVFEEHGFNGPAVHANDALRGAGVKAKARGGHAPRGALTLASTALHCTAAGAPLNLRKRCIHFDEEPKKGLVRFCLGGARTRCPARAA